jgi:hypothetical protein
MQRATAQVWGHASLTRPGGCRALPPLSRPRSMSSWLLQLSAVSAAAVHLHLSAVSAAAARAEYGTLMKQSKQEVPQNARVNGSRPLEWFRQSAGQDMQEPAGFIVSTQQDGQSMRLHCRPACDTPKQAVAQPAGPNYCACCQWPQHCLRHTQASACTCLTSCAVSDQLVTAAALAA